MGLALLSFHYQEERIYGLRMSREMLQPIFCLRLCKYAHKLMT